MSRHGVMVVVMLALVSLSVPVFAHEGSHDGHEHATPASAPGTDALEVGNKICPVSGEKVGEMGDVVKYEYKGKIYNLCCAMCEGDFKKDPEKYSKIAEDEVASSMQ